MSFYIKIITSVLFFLLSTNSFAGDLFDMLKRMSDADQNHSYQGTFILRKSDNLSTLHVTHGVDENGIWETLESLSGEHKKVIKRNEQVVSISPKNKTITIRKTDKQQSLHVQLPDNLDKLSSYYSMARLNDDRIANHEALVVDLLPKDKFRYGYRYWIEKNTGVLLRCDLVDEDKAVVEQMMFTSIEYLSEPPTESFDLNQYRQYQLQKLVEPTANDVTASHHWTVNNLPKGFMLKHSVVRHLQPVLHDEESGKENNKLSTAEAVKNNTLKLSPQVKKLAGFEPDLLHLVYSDGLASVSIFIEKNQGAEKHLQGASAMGAVNAYGHLVGDHFVTVVGEVPANTVQSMAMSTVKLSQ